MAAEIDHPPGIITLVSRLVRTSVGAIQNRFELLTLEWQEERARLAELLVWVVAFLFFGMMTAVLLTATIIFLCPKDIRVYVAGGFTFLFFVGTISAWMVLRSMLRRETFAESIDQVKRDREWLKSLD